MTLAALQEGLITENSTLPCGGSFMYGNRSYACHGAHGNINARTAIKVSCNVYFYRLALKMGLETMSKYAKMFGFGNKTEIDLPNESRGLFPDENYWNKRKGFSKGLLVNYGIGQGEISITPIQMAAYISTIANKGVVYQPHLVKAMYNHITNKFEGFEYGARILPINPHHFEVVEKGMHDVVHSSGGTAYMTYLNHKYMLPGIDIYGKTGTAQNPHGKSHSWFVCYAVRDGKKIALSIIVENVGYGAEYAAPIAMKMISNYYGLDTLKPYTPNIDSLNVAKNN